MPKRALKTLAQSEIGNRSSYFEEHKEQIVKTIRQLVEVESPTDSKQAVDALGSLLAGRFEALVGHAKFH